MEQSLLTLLKQMCPFISMVSVSCHWKSSRSLCISTFFSLPSPFSLLSHHFSFNSSPLSQCTPSQFTFSLSPPSSAALVPPFSTLLVLLSNNHTHNIITPPSLQCRWSLLQRVDIHDYCGCWCTQGDAITQPKWWTNIWQNFFEETHKQTILM